LKSKTFGWYRQTKQAGSISQLLQGNALSQQKTHQGVFALMGLMRVNMLTGWNPHENP
jgi:hypothetical protein